MIIAPTNVGKSLKFSRVATISMPSTFFGASAISPDGSQLYFGQGNSISQFSADTNTITSWSVALGYSPNNGGITISPDGTKLYAARYQNSGSNYVNVINTATATVSATISIGTSVTSSNTAISPNGAKLYIVNGTSTGNFVVVNLLTNTLETGFTVGTGGARGIGFSPDSSTMWVAQNASPASVHRVNTATKTVTTTISVSPLAYPVACLSNADHSKVYVVSESRSAAPFENSNIAVINTATNTVSSTVTSGLGTYVKAAEINPDGSAVWGASPLPRIWALSTSTLVADFVGETPGFFSNARIHFTPDGLKAYVLTSTTIEIIYAKEP